MQLKDIILSRKAITLQDPVEQCLQQTYERFVCEKNQKLGLNSDQIIVIHNPGLVDMDVVTNTFPVPDANTHVKAMRWNQTNKLFEDVVQEVFCFEGPAFSFECQHLAYTKIIPFESEVFLYSLSSGDQAGQRVKSFGFDGLYQKGGLDGSSVEEEELPEDV